jgi:hypothetical protein
VINDQNNTAALRHFRDETEGDTFQMRVQPWMMNCFGPAISADIEERNHRFLEESLELVQASGCTASEAHQLVDYVFGRPVGELQQEIGGAMVTLAALCLAHDADMHAAGETELARIWTKVEAIRTKQAARPKHSPLPAAASQESTSPRSLNEDRADFEQWFATRGYRDSSFSSRDCMLQWSAWLAGASGNYRAPADWKVSPLPWGPAAAPQVVADELSSVDGFYNDPVRDIALALAAELEVAELDPNDFVTVNRAKLELIAERVLEKAKSTLVQAQEPVVTVSRNSDDSLAFAPLIDFHVTDGMPLFLAPVQPMAVPAKLPSPDLWVYTDALRMQRYHFGFKPETHPNASGYYSERIIKQIFPTPAAQGDAKDAERYRWLRDHHVGDDPGVINLTSVIPLGMDSAIDAAIAAKAAS